MGPPERVWAWVPAHPWNADDARTAEALAAAHPDWGHAGSLAGTHPAWGKNCIPGCLISLSDIVWAARAELCMTVEDALSRRTRSLLLDAQAAIDCAPAVATLLATELEGTSAWQVRQVAEFTQELAQGYLAFTQ